MIPRIEPMIKIGISKPGIPPPPPIRTDIEVVGEFLVLIFQS